MTSVGAFAIRSAWHDLAMLAQGRGIAVIATALMTVGLTACTSTTQGSGNGAPPSTPTTSTTPASVATSPAAPTTHASTSPSVTIIPAPSKPLSTHTVTSFDGVVYKIAIWQEVNNTTCVGHAYGQPVIAFLAAHPCYNGLNRMLGTLTFNGKSAGFAQSTLTIQTPGSPNVDPYKNSAAFKKLVLANNTGSITDLLRDGYRLPSGPTAIPSSEAFTVIGQDSTIEIWDAWYLTGPTPNNDPALVKAATDIFLQY